jgi:hypothetical protein
MGLAGCASVASTTSGVLTDEQARRYAALPPFDFVQRRFFEEEKTKILDAIESAAKGYANAINRLQGRKPVAEDSIRKPELSTELSMVTWPAYFTDKNYVQLARPAVELRRYCQAAAGQWSVVERYADDPLATLRQDPVVAFLDAQARVARHFKATGAYAGFEEMRDVIASDVGVQMAEEAAQRNRRVAWLFSAEGMRYAQRLDAFGMFVCEQGGGKRWLASVLPAVLVGRDEANQVDTSMARLAIRVYQRRP